MRKTKLLVLAQLCTVFSLTAQEFKWKAEIEIPKQEGFQNILLAPEVTGRLRSDFADLRIYDAANKQIPYLLRAEVASSNEEIFKQYKIISKEIKKGVRTTLIILNQNRNNINNISLIIRNSDVQKRFKLSGSDDQKNWYVIKDNYEFSGMYSMQTTSEIKLVNFPLSNYLYYKVEVNDKLSEPLNIMSAGYYDTYVEQGKYTEIKAPEILQIDSAIRKQSFVYFNFDQNHYLDHLNFEIEGPIYYLRNACLVQINTEDSSELKNRDCIQNFELSSNGINSLSLDRIAGSQFCLIIDNEDNQELKIKSVKALQLNTYLTAQLKKEAKYELLFGSEDAEAAQYDLRFFQNKIPEEIPMIKTGAIKSINGAAPEEIDAPKKESSWLIWSAIIIVVLLLTYISVKMIRDMK